MEFDHERLDVYHLALDFLTLAEQLIAALPKGRSHLVDQLTRASLSIVLNIAEGAGKTSPADKRRYYITARGSATESAALLDVYFRLKLAPDKEHRAGKEMLWRIVSMLVKLARSLESAAFRARARARARTLDSTALVDAHPARLSAPETRAP